MRKYNCKGSRLTIFFVQTRFHNSIWYLPASITLQMCGEARNMNYLIFYTLSLIVQIYTVSFYIPCIQKKMYCSWSCVHKWNAKPETFSLGISYLWWRVQYSTKYFNRKYELMCINCSNVLVSFQIKTLAFQNRFAFSYILQH